MTIRDEQDEDHPAVRELHRRAFGDQGDSVAQLVDALRPATLSLVQEEDGEILGHVMSSRGLLDAPRRLVEVQTLSPLAVQPERQRQGIGRALVRRVVELLDERGAPMVFLEGDPAYYSRLGFVPGGELGFRKPSLRIPDAAFQVMTLSAYEPWMTGTHVYAAIFWELDCVGLRDPDA